jgi:hypothetical protein
MAFGPWCEIAIGRDGVHLKMLPFASIAQPFGIEFSISDDERHRRVIRLVRLLALVCRVTGQAKASGIIYIVNGHLIRRMFVIATQTEFQCFAPM